MKRFFLLCGLLSVFATAMADNHHTVSEGETLRDIANRYGITIESLRSHNPQLAQQFYAGMVLTIPTSQTQPTTATGQSAAQDSYQQANNQSSERQSLFKNHTNLFTLNVGLGSIHAYENGSAFQQELSWEHVLNASLIHNKAFLSVGLQFDRSKSTDRICLGTNLSGHYNYEYVITEYKAEKSSSGYRWKNSKSYSKKRSGSGFADVYADDIEDYSAMLTVGFHFQPIKTLDVYAKIGGGVCYRMFDFYRTNESGFSKMSYSLSDHGKPTNSIDFAAVYSYNDYWHVNWDDSELVPNDDKVIGTATCFYLGASYYILPRLAFNIQFGMTNGLVSSSSPTTIGLIDAGLTFRL